MINHRICGEAAKMRPLTRKFKTRVYGPWLRCDHKVLACNGLPVKFYYSQPKPFVDMGLTYEETVTYAQFMVVVQVDVVYKSEQEWGGKKLVRSLLVTFEIDRISPLAKLTSEDKTSIVLGLVASLVKQRKTWLKKRWIPCKVRVEKTVMVPPVDMEVMLEEAKDKKLHKTIDINIVKMVGFPLGKSDDLLRKTIRDAIREVGQTQFPDSYVESWVRLVKRPKYYSRLILEKDCHKCVKVLGPDMDMFDACCICQEGFFLGGYATITSCSHVFHSSCITDWINKSTKCPLCRVQLEVYTLMI
ncbi:BnaC06g29690D [Brassica napus]|uniref:RING-type E3 ubiquitin transferase n=1 Tax=Brassica napus TaxID=3708 RepID=A0A078H9T5_BRANA|nr:BnaC06g29690D [Brassica napus]